MARNLVVTLTTLVIFAATHAKALGLGDITLDSALNQPLSARIELLDMGAVRPADISVGLASEADFRRFELDRPYFLENISFAVNSTGNNAHVLLSTDAAVREPYLSFVLETRWPNGRVLSEYTVLLDPPVFGAQAAAQTTLPPARTLSDPVAPAREQAPARSQPQEPAAPASQVQRFAAAEATAEQESEQAAVAAPAPTQQAAPEAEPAPAANRAAAATADTVTVEDEDTLWDIALRVRPDNTYSVQQTMLALQRLNNDAFIADNINMIRRGQVLRVPDARQILAITQQQAVAEVATQNQRFAERRSAPVSAQPVTPPPAQNRNATAGSGGQLSVVTTDDDADQDDDASGNDAAALEARVNELEDDLAVSSEEADRVRLENTELSERLAMLEEQISAAQEIIRLRDLELAQLQESARTQQSAAEPEDTTPEQPATVVTMAPEQGFPASLINLLMANTYALIGAIALIVLLLVLFLVQRSRQKEEEVAEDEEEEDYSGPGAQIDETEEESDQAVEADDDEQTSNDDEELVWDIDSEYEQEFGDSEEQEVDPDEEVEAVAELQEHAVTSDASEVALEQAETFMAYDQNQEARAVLRNAIVADPNNARLRLKLLEVCVAEQDVVGFQLQEAELRTFADEEDLALLALLRARMPDDDFEDDEDDQQDSIATGSEYDFDSADDSLTPEEEIELDLDLNASAEVDDDKVVDGADPDGSDDSADSSEEDEQDFSFDFDLSDTSDLESEPESAEADADADVADDAEEDFESVDFEFALEDDEEQESVADQQDTEAAEVLEAGTEFDDLEFIVSDEQSLAEDADEEDDDGGLDFLTDSDEAATKLDLARAYIDMGDRDGAREILEEVLDEGTESQIAEAETLLERTK